MNTIKNLQRRELKNCYVNLAIFTIPSYESVKAFRYNKALYTIIV